MARRRAAKVGVCIKCGLEGVIGPQLSPYWYEGGHYWLHPEPCSVQWHEEMRRLGPRPKMKGKR